MTKEMKDYADLDAEGSWITYVRRRLPYSFRKIHKNGRRFVLSEPQYVTGFARHHFVFKEAKRFPKGCRAAPGRA